MGYLIIRNTNNLGRISFKKLTNNQARTRFRLVNTGSSGGFTPEPLPSPSSNNVRYALSSDTGSITNANVGDLLILGGTYTGIDNLPAVYIGPTSNWPLSAGKKILIAAGQYDTIDIYNPSTGSTENPIVITNYGGQVETRKLRLYGLGYFKLTGKYNPTNKTGHYYYKGHDDGYAFSQEKYGIFVNNDWTSNSGFLLQVSSYTSASVSFHPTDYEIEYLEIGNGGFSSQFKTEDVGYVINNVKLHDCYFHDTHGEGIYIGSTAASTGNPQNVFRNLQVYNNRFIRAGNDGLQINRMVESSSIYNNVIVLGGINWRNNFMPSQDYGASISFRNGNTSFKNNMVVGSSGNSTIVYVVPENWYTGSVTPTGSVNILNNAYLYCRGENAAFLGPDSRQLAGVAFNITGNDFGKFNYQHNTAFPTETKRNYVIYELYSQSAIAPLNYINNKWDGSDGRTLFYTSGQNPTTDTNNITGSVEDIQFMDFYIGDTFNYYNLNMWAPTYFQNPGDDQYGPQYYPYYTVTASLNNYNAGLVLRISASISGAFTIVTSSVPDSHPNYYIISGSTPNETITNLVNKINQYSSSFFITSSIVNSVSFSLQSPGVTGSTYRFVSGSRTYYFGGIKGKPIQYSPGEYVIHKSRIYKCIQSASLTEPGTGSGWESYWELQTYNNGTSYLPADDVRIPTSSIYNTLGRGLLDNPTASYVPSPFTQSLTTINSWNAYVKLPAGYNDAENASTKYPLIMFMPGLGETGTDASKLLTYGPSGYINNGTWDGRAYVNGEWIDPIIISLQNSGQWNNTPTAVDTRVNTILNNYRVDTGSIHYTGLSAGAWGWNLYATYKANSTDTKYYNRPASIVNVEGAKPDSTYGSMEAYPVRFGYLAAAGCKYLGFEQVNDFRDIQTIVNTMNATASNSAIYKQTNFGNGGHCCFNEFYNPSASFVVNGVSQSIYQWMLSNTKN